jgi:uncharacterized peroxidase-related enzyme
VSADPELPRAIRRDWRTAPLSTRERAICAYAEKLTLDPAALGPGDVESLRREGLTDQGVLQVVLIAAFFNYVNRVADALGVGRTG